MAVPSAEIATPPPPPMPILFDKKEKGQTDGKKDVFEYTHVCVYFLHDSFKASRRRTRSDAFSCLRGISKTFKEMRMLGHSLILALSLSLSLSLARLLTCAPNECELT